MTNPTIADLIKSRLHFFAAIATLTTRQQHPATLLKEIADKAETYADELHGIDDPAIVEIVNQFRWIRLRARAGIIARTNERQRAALEVIRTRAEEAAGLLSEKGENNETTNRRRNNQ